MTKQYEQDQELIKSRLKWVGLQPWWPSYKPKPFYIKPIVLLQKFYGFLYFHFKYKCFKFPDKTERLRAKYIKLVTKVSKLIKIRNKAYSKYMKELGKNK